MLGSGRFFCLDISSNDRMCLEIVRSSLTMTLIRRELSNKEGINTFYFGMVWANFWSLRSALGALGTGGVFFNVVTLVSGKRAVFENSSIF